MTGRDRTCGASRFRRALYRLSYGHVKWWAEPESNRRPPPYQRGTLPPELSAVDEWARLDSNQQHRVCKTRALPLSYSPALVTALQIRDKESNLDLHVQSVVSCRLDDPGMVVRAYVTLGSMPNDVFHASRLPFDPGSPTVRCALCDGRRPTWRSFGARSSVAIPKKRMLKPMLIAHG